MTRVAVICGTGMSELSKLYNENYKLELSEIRTDTEWGEVPISIINREVDKIFILDRHHSVDGRRTPPHMIEHRANIFAIRSCNPDIILSINSVGSMRDDLPPGDIGISGDIIDLTQVPWTFFDDDANHSDRTSIFDRKGIECCEKALLEQQNPVINGLIVAQCIGPQFETPSEIDALVKLGADVVGMTLGPEQRLISEFQIPHVSLVCSSNWAAGRTPGNRKAAINHHEVDSMASTLKSKIIVCINSLTENF
jgi:5'-methylthioadenosine phosphorylase